MSVADRFNAVLNALNIKVPSLSKKIGIAHSYLYGIKNGTQELTPRVLDALELRFNVNPAYLEHGQDPMFKTPQKILSIEEAPHEWKIPLVATEAIKDLYNMKEEGIITEEQFKASREAILAQLKRWGEKLQSG